MESDPIDPADPAANESYYLVTGSDARGNVTQYKLANGVTTTNQAYNAKTGRIEGIETLGALGIKAQSYAVK